MMIFTAKKALVSLMCLIILSLMMCGCQSKQEQGDESTKDVTDIDDTTENTSTPQWKTEYLNFLETKKDTYLSYALVYIDNDGIPELYLSGDSEATGDSICSYKNGAVVEQRLNRIGGGWYVEKSGNIINQNGNMGSLYTHVYKLTDDKFELTFNALSIEHVEILENDEYKIYYEYSIGDKPATEAEYKAAVEAAFNFEGADRLGENAVEYDSIRQKIIDFN